MSDERFRVALASDLHAYSGDLPEGERPSFLWAGAAADTSSDPAAALLDLVKKEGLTVDLMLATGDLGDKASPEGLKYAWSFLNALAAELGAPLAATAGNHDVDSGRHHADDPFEALKGLRPLFPWADQ